MVSMLTECRVAACRGVGLLWPCWPPLRGSGTTVTKRKRNSSLRSRVAAVGLRTRLPQVSWLLIS